MRNNKGLSLVELIVVIAIIAIVAGITMISINSTNGSKMSRAVESLEAELGKTKTDSLTQDPENVVPLCIKNVNGSLCFVDTSGNMKQTFGDKKCELAYVLEGQTVKNYLSEGEVLKISFKRGSGAFGTCTLPDGTNAHCEKIIIERNGKSRTMILVKETGKFYLE